MRRVNWLIIHHSAADFEHTVDDIRSWHIQRGFQEIGYHFIIDKLGEVHNGRDVEKMGAHCRGHNAGSIGICLMGLFDKEDPLKQPTEAQLRSLEILLINLCSKYDLEKMDILPHSSLSDTLCPGFDFEKWLASRSWH